MADLDDENEGPVVTGISPSAGLPGTKVTIRGENLGESKDDIIGMNEYDIPLYYLTSDVNILLCFRADNQWSQLSAEYGVFFLEEACLCSPQRPRHRPNYRQHFQQWAWSVYRPNHHTAARSETAAW